MTEILRLYHGTCCAFDHGIASKTIQNGILKDFPSSDCQSIHKAKELDEIINCARKAHQQLPPLHSEEFKKATETMRNSNKPIQVVPNLICAVSVFLKYHTQNVDLKQAHKDLISSQTFWSEVPQIEEKYVPTQYAYFSLFKMFKKLREYEKKLR